MCLLELHSRCSIMRRFMEYNGYKKGLLITVSSSVPMILANEKDAQSLVWVWRWCEMGECDFVAGLSVESGFYPVNKILSQNAVKNHIHLLIILGE